MLAQPASIVLAAELLCGRPKSVHRISTLRSSSLNQRAQQPQSISVLSEKLSMEEKGVSEHFGHRENPLGVRDVGENPFVKQ